MTTFKAICILILATNIKLSEQLKCFECISDGPAANQTTFELKEASLPPFPKDQCGDISSSSTEKLQDCGPNISCVKIEISGVFGDKIVNNMAVRMCDSEGKDICQRVTNSPNLTSVCHSCDTGDGCNSAVSPTIYVPTLFAIFLMAKLCL